MVAFDHVPEQIFSYQPHLAFAAGEAGVDIFFIVSGCIMMITTRESTVSDFIARRIIRIVPLYWLFTLVLCTAY